jgi:hypothetical protein
MVFCQVDKKLVDLIREYAGKRAIVDCGCGDGLLGLIMKDIISIDFIERDSEILGNIIHMDVVNYPFTEYYFPVFLRPCHGHFTHRFLDVHENNIKNMLYVSKPHNLEIDIDTEYYNVKEIDGWTGEEGERAYLVTMPWYLERH